MIFTKQIHKYRLLSVLVLLLSFSALADGSKDIYPAGAQGGRAFLRASESVSPAFPFPSLGTHYVYAEAGERIALASSAQAYGSTNQTRDWNRNNIRLYGPGGQQITLETGSNTNTPGLIRGRSQELAGPQLPGQTGEGRYVPIYHTAAESGIYRVEFLSTSRSLTGDSRENYAAADNNWTQGSNSNYLAAWDVSVARQTGNTWNWVSGRVYTTVLNMDNPSYNSWNTGTFRPNSGFHGKFKILTRDGFVYNVDNNGNQGISFTFMVNNRGFHLPNNPGTPSYQSIFASLASQVQNRYHDPRSPDTEASVTQKIFYTLPDSGMPESAIGAVPGGQTWLRVPEKELHIDEILVEGVEGSQNQLGDKGAYIKFYSESGGDYYIRIMPTPGSSSNFPIRELSGPSSIGENEIYWAGKDGDDNPLPIGLSDVTVEVRLRGAEVHFPYIDMELNQNGIIIELLASDLQSVVTDAVFWDDSSIGNGGGNSGSKSTPRNASHTVDPLGISSSVNGHIWGIGSDRTAGTFGDNMGMDTWTFIEGDAVSTQFVVDVRMADLEISAVTPNRATVETDDEVTFTINARNNGPNDVTGSPFSFIIPEGYEPVSFSFDGNNCGAEAENLFYDAASRTYHSRLDLPNDCEVTYEVTLRATSASAVGENEFTATIMRPNDVTDPDATNPDIHIPPTDPFYECENNGLGGECNNILSATISFLINPAIDLLKEGVYTDSNNNGYPDPGDEIHYTFTVINTGDVPLTQITVSDPLVTVSGGPVDLDIDESDSTSFTAVYVITQEDVDRGGVYNLATATGIDPADNEVSTSSRDPHPLLPGNPAYNPDCPDCTFVPLENSGLLITNPMLYQLLLNLE